MGDYAHNQAGFDNTRGLIYQFNSDGDPSSFVGMMVLGGTAHSAAGWPAGSPPGDPLTDQDKYDRMVAPPPIEEITGDYRILLTKQPFDLAVNEFHTIYIGLVFGDGLEELQAHADVMQQTFLDFVVPEGSITGTVSVNGTALENVLAKLLDDQGIPLDGFDDQYTDANGQFSFVGVPAGNYQVMIVEPLGYSADSNPKIVSVTSNATTTVDFLLTEVVLLNNARSKGYWKHQFDVYIRNKGNAQESEQNLLDYIAEVGARYAIHFNIFDGMTDGVNDFEEWQSVLSVKGNEEMEAKATSQLAALVLNLMSLKLDQYEIVTEDGKTAGAVLTYVSELIEDGNGSNDELAKDLAEYVNLQQTIAAGLVNPSQYILYRRGSGSGLGKTDINIPLTYGLDQNYPNPFNPSTTISFAIPENGNVSIEVYNTLGEQVETVLSRYLVKGRYNIDFDANCLPSGIYLYRLDVNGYSKVKKMILMK